MVPHIEIEQVIIIRIIILNLVIVTGHNLAALAANEKGNKLCV